MIFKFFLLLVMEYKFILVLSCFGLFIFFLMGNRMLYGLFVREYFFKIELGG